MHSDHLQPGCILALVMLTGPNLIVAACVSSGVIESSGLDHDFVSKVAVPTLPNVYFFGNSYLLLPNFQNINGLNPKLSARYGKQQFFIFLFNITVKVN